MSSELFINFIRKFYRRITVAKRKIVVIVDNCPSHPRIEHLENIKLVFLPPITTAFSQPMDAGMIKNLKYFYKLEIVRRRIAAIENDQSFSLNLLQALLIIQKSWEKVSQRTIENCFRHVGFGEGFMHNDDTINGISEDTEKQISEHFPEANLGDYLDADENLDTSNGTTEEAIVRDILGEELSDDSDQEVNVNEEDPRIIPTRESAAAAMKILRLFLENQEGSSKSIMSLSKIEGFITDLTFQKFTKQTLITSYNVS